MLQPCGIGQEQFPLSILNVTLHESNQIRYFAQHDLIAKLFLYVGRKVNFSKLQFVFL